LRFAFSLPVYTRLNGDASGEVMAGTVTPLQECLILGRRGVMTTNVAIGEHVNDFRVGRQALDPTLFVTVTAAEDVCLEYHVDKIHQLSNQV